MVAFGGPAAAETPEEIRDRLVDRIDGYTLQPEGDHLAGASGAVDVAAAAMAAGVDAEAVPGDAGAYARVFTSDEYDGLTIVLMGIDITGHDGTDVLDSLDALHDIGHGGEQLWVDLEPPLDGLVSYSLMAPDPERGVVPIEVTAFVADDLLVTVEIRGPIAGLDEMREVIGPQIELTPPTLTPGLPGADADNDPDTGPAAPPPGPGTGDGDLRRLFPDDGGDDLLPWAAALAVALAVALTVTIVRTTHRP